jgi:hypothetical protein
MLAVQTGAATLSQPHQTGAGERTHARIALKICAEHCQPTVGASRGEGVETCVRARAEALGASMLVCAFTRSVKGYKEVVVQLLYS